MRPQRNWAAGSAKPQELGPADQPDERHPARSRRTSQLAGGAGGGVELPFGGFKNSGHGREKGLEALKEFSATKTVVINHG